MLALDPAALRAAHARHRGLLPAGWPADASTAALESLLARGLPDTRSEAFRYTDLGGFAARLVRDLENPATAAAPAAEPALATLVPSGCRIELTDGRGGAPALPAGLIRAGADRLFGAGAEPPSPLVDLNTAFASDGLALDVADGVTVPGTLVIHDRVRATGTVVQPRLALRVGAGASLAVVQVVTGAAGTAANSVARIELAAGARLTLLRLQESGAGACRLDRTELVLAAGAEASVTTVDLGGGAPARQDLVVSLAGDDARLDAAGLCLAGGSGHVDHYLAVTHRGRRTTSRSQWRSVADGTGRVVFNGRIVVAPGAAGTDAALSNRNLLLSARAEIDTRPELEIYTDDVRCSHGATTGQLDPAALFYLRSRGLPAAAARRVLIGAFTAELLARITDAGLREAITDRATAVLEPA